MLNFEVKSDRRAIFLFATAVIMLLFVLNNHITAKTSNILALAVGNSTPSKEVQNIQIWFGGVLAGGVTSTLFYFLARFISRFTTNRLKNTVKIFTVLSILSTVGILFKILPSISILNESTEKQAMLLRIKLENSGIDLSNFRNDSN